MPRTLLRPRPLLAAAALLLLLAPALVSADHSGAYNATRTGGNMQCNTNTVPPAKAGAAVNGGNLILATGGLDNGQITLTAAGSTLGNLGCTFETRVTGFSCPFGTSPSCDVPANGISQVLCTANPNAPTCLSSTTFQYTFKFQSPYDTTPLYVYYDLIVYTGSQPTHTSPVTVATGQVEITALGSVGDITAVLAGTGLQGGGSSGDVTLRLNTDGIAACTDATAHKVVWSSAASRLACATDRDTTYSASMPIALAGTTVSLSPSGCAAGSLWKWSGTQWSCLPDQDTPYTAGDGLALSGNQFSLKDCAAGQVLKGDGAGLWACAADADAGGDVTAVNVQAGSGLTGGAASGDATLGTDPAVLQRRVSGACALGSALRTVNQDGTVACQGFWSILGNAGTSALTNFLGTTDNQAFEVRVNNARAWRVEPAASPNLVGGSSANAVTSGALGALVAGGGDSSLPNSVTDSFGVVGGGRGNRAGDAAGTVSDSAYATVGGGDRNAAVGIYSTVGGGVANAAAQETATVAGGMGNRANLRSFVGGGENNWAWGQHAVVGGGFGHNASGQFGAVLGGQANVASGQFSSVLGGNGNTASGQFATAAGGNANTAQASYSFAAGNRAKALHLGAFVWGDNSNADFASTAANQFNVRATGGTRIVSAVDASGNPTAGVTLAPGSGSWATLSDRDSKRDVHPVDARAVLQALVHLPLATWSYKAQDAGVRHMGPMAQDFRAAFGLGEEETRISTVDADGVALAAIQGLYEEMQEKDARIQAQQERIAELDARLAALEARLAALG